MEILWSGKTLASLLSPHTVCLQQWWPYVCCCQHQPHPALLYVHLWEHWQPQGTQREGTYWLRGTMFTPYERTSLSSPSPSGPVHNVEHWWQPSGQLQHGWGSVRVECGNVQTREGECAQDVQLHLFGTHTRPTYNLCSWFGLYSTQNSSYFSS